jgi:CBS domain-containing protein
VHRTFLDEEIHGAPVVSDEGAMLGAITLTDLVRAALDTTESAAFSSDYLRELVEFSGPDWQGGPADFQDRLGQLTAAEVMTPSPASVTASAPVADVAKLMHERRIHRVWVVTERGALAGVISSFDLLPLIANAKL